MNATANQHAAESSKNASEIIDGISRGPKGVLTRQELIWLALGQVIGAGVIALIGPSINATGTSVWLAYVVSILFGVLIVFPFYVMSGTIRLSGGVYSSVYEIVGKRAGGIYLIGSIPAMVLLASYPIAIATYIKAIIPGVNSLVISFLALTLFYVINMMGAKFMAKIQTYISYCLMLGLLAFIIFGLPKINWAQISFSSPNFITHGTGGFFKAVFILIFSTHSYYYVIGYSNNARNSRKDCPFAMRIAIPIILILYGGCGMVAAGVLPIDEVAGKPLTYVAKEALPTVIFWIFYLGGAMGALLTSLNSSFGFYANMFAGGAEDGWLPEIFARKNKHGAYYFVLTLGYVIGLLPIIFRFPVEAVTSNMMFVNALLMCLAYIAAWKLPSKYPELWNNSLTKMPVGVFHVIMVFSFLMEAATVVYSAMSSNIFALVVSILIMIISVFYAGYRLKAGKVKSKASIWFD